MTRTKYVLVEPREPFDAHLFHSTDTDDAALMDDGTGRVDTSIPPLCSQTTSHGPFEAVTLDAIEADLPDRDFGLCKRCRNHATGGGDE